MARLPFGILPHPQPPEGGFDLIRRCAPTSPASGRS